MVNKLEYLSKLHQVTKHWEQLCKDINYRHLSMVDLIQQLGHGILGAAQLEKEDIMIKRFYNPIVDKIINFLQTSIDSTLKQFAQ